MRGHWAYGGCLGRGEASLCARGGPSGRGGKGAQAGPSGSGGTRGIQLGLLVKNGRKEMEPKKERRFSHF